MKRRDFLTRSVGLACALVPGLSLSKPCPPVVSGAASGGSAACGTPEAEADWRTRVSDPGVVWFHDFRTDAEVDNFRWAGGYGNDPNDLENPGRCVRNTSDGITGGGCLELIYPVGTSGAPGWWRPFAPMNGASNGRGENDPGAGGTIALAPWEPANRSENEHFFQAYYANPAYFGVDGFAANRFNGSEFWLQFRIKMDTNRYRSGTPEAGKLSFLATTQQTLNQEIVQQNMWDGRALWYTNFGYSPDTGASMGVKDGSLQPGGPYEDCGPGSETNGCWLFEGGEWVTFLYHMVPGTEGNKDTFFEVFVARQGETEYETLFSQMNTIHFSDASSRHPRGYNSFQPSNYMNGQTTTVQWYQRYDQIIFSHNSIPCPQV